mmetsp:Transcript_106201/g.285493  ORF Transcript_106201/g.285493 Transcript_106201/m.285493 type:complete len:248 (+) Transcript_106201:1227-1970(+)
MTYELSATKPLSSIPVPMLGASRHPETTIPSISSAPTILKHQLLSSSVVCFSTMRRPAAETLDSQRPSVKVASSWVCSGRQRLKHGIRSHLFACMRLSLRASIAGSITTIPMQDITSENTRPRQKVARPGRSQDVTAPTPNATVEVVELRVTALPAMAHAREIISGTSSLPGATVFMADRSRNTLSTPTANVRNGVIGDRTVRSRPRKPSSPKEAAEAPAGIRRLASISKYWVFPGTRVSVLRNATM